MHPEDNVAVPAGPSYLLLDRHHVVAIDDLAPDALKRAIKSAARNPDAQGDRHTTLLNAVVKKLGFKGGFAGYKNDQHARLARFLADHGLRERQDLIRSRSSVFHAQGRLTRRQVSDRLFLSGRTVPRRIFTGYDFDWSRFDLDDNAADDERMSQLLYQSASATWEQAKQEPWLARALIRRNFESVPDDPSVWK